MVLWDDGGPPEISVFGNSFNLLLQEHLEGSLQDAVCLLGELQEGAGDLLAWQDASCSLME